MLNRICIALIRFYQIVISPIKPKKVKCRFHPTCSNYSLMAIKKYGAIQGIKKTWARLKKCNPYNRDSAIDYP
ncbi:membrane protein insertion efficiency factor YidD [Alkalicoccobacillus plakortidis]|uniref:Putative membrane protein insertion efficiency factor n=1 Tax=Alkalicoccobacillus plakortidis TaxID=444060 RepID=A0ABT0XI28_9BACI|nr:membrane protein insertion efficiency factor YidD [Alkalicoccobacillus plakortidis]MCM2675557.1 membrane protein insertion efficiency factor YidD [Alkalicoccobacillus plakortidis]